MNNNGYLTSKLVRARLLHNYLCELCGYAGYPSFINRATTRQGSAAQQLQLPKTRRRRAPPGGRGGEGTKEGFVPLGVTLARVSSQQRLAEQGGAEEEQQREQQQDEQQGRGQQRGMQDQRPGGQAVGVGIPQVPDASTAGGGVATGGGAASAGGAGGAGGAGEAVHGVLHQKDEVPLDMVYIWENAPIALLLQVRFMGVGSASAVPLVLCCF